MKHPFSGLVSKSTELETTGSAEAKVLGRRQALMTLGLAIPAVAIIAACGSSRDDVSESKTVTTMALGEEGGKCDKTITTKVAHEEGGKDTPITTMALGEEGGKCDTKLTTKALNEEGGKGPITTLALGEEGGNRR